MSKVQILVVQCKMSFCLQKTTIGMHEDCLYPLVSDWFSVIVFVDVQQLYNIDTERALERIFCLPPFRKKYLTQTSQIAGYSVHGMC